MEEASGVFKSWARYMIRSFFFCSARSISLFCLSSVCLTMFIFRSMGRSSGDSEISPGTPSSSASIPLPISPKYPMSHRRKTESRAMNTSRRDSRIYASICLRKIRS